MKRLLLCCVGFSFFPRVIFWNNRLVFMEMCTVWCPYSWDLKIPAALLTLMLINSINHCSIKMEQYRIMFGSHFWFNTVFFTLNILHCVIQYLKHDLNWWVTDKDPQIIVFNCEMRKSLQWTETSFIFFHFIFFFIIWVLNVYLRKWKWEIGACWFWTGACLNIHKTFPPLSPNKHVGRAQAHL